MGGTLSDSITPPRPFLRHEEGSMPQTPHIEKHFTASESVRDVVIGMSDGLTVPFALAAGLSGAVSSTAIIVTAGVAEIAAGSIAMGLGGYLAARGDADHYASERAREEREVRELPERETEEVAVVFRGYGLSENEIAPVLRAFQEKPAAWIDFMMRFELGLEAPDPRRALRSALTIAGAYIAGGLVPLAPYMLARTAAAALPGSIGFTLLALAAFGWAKGNFTGVHPLKSAFQTVLVGGLAAAAAFTLAKLLA
jgi:VIT1/CCC1 family predicted Fe2+/Mn2+ transporter